MRYDEYLMFKKVSYCKVCGAKMGILDGEGTICIDCEIKIEDKKELNLNTK